MVNPFPNPCPIFSIIILSEIRPSISKIYKTSPVNKPSKILDISIHLERSPIFFICDIEDTIKILNE